VFGSGGHNSLGAWWWLADTGKLTLGGDLTVFHQEIGDRVSRVAIAQKHGRLAYVEMEQSPLEAGLQVTDVGRLTRSLGITRTDLATNRLPCQVVSTGVAHLLVPLRDRDAVDRIRPNGDELRTVLARSALRAATHLVSIRRTTMPLRMHGSSIRRLGYQRIPRPARRLAPWPLNWLQEAYCNRDE